MRPILVLAVVVGLLALSPRPARAAEFKGGPNPTVERGTTIDDDLYLSGGRARIAGEVTGDLVAAVGDLDVTGELGGSLNAAVGTADLRGPVGRSVRVTAGEVTVRSTVGGDLVVLGGAVTVERGATVRGDVVAAGGDVDVLGTVVGDVRGSAGEVTIEGRVGGDVRVSADRFQVAPQARIDGDLRFRSDDHSISPNATVGGTRTELGPRRYLPWVELPGSLGFALVRLLAGLIAGAVVVLLLPRAAARVADGVRREPLASLLAGLILAVFVPVGVVALLATVVGIPIALIGAALFAAGLYLSQVVVGLALGRAILPKSWDTAGRGYNLLAMTLGVIALAALRLIPVPFLGTGIAAVTAVFGLGALVVGPRRAAAPTPLGYGPEPGTSYIR
jgi:cytoskeletal protein CcmA (bactofilin family)